jgi:hypothetical protein
MNDLFVHRCTHRRRIAVIPLERRFRSSLAHPLLGHGVNLRRRHARLHHLAKLGENPGDELVHPPQLLNLGLRAADNHSVLRPSSATTGRSVVAAGIPRSERACESYASS